MPSFSFRMMLLGGGGVCVVGEETWRWVPGTPTPSLPNSFLPPPPPPPQERTESGHTRDISCAVHPPLRACGAGWGWRRGPEGGLARYDFLNQRLAGSTACSGRAFSATLSPGWLAVTPAARPYVFPAWGAAVGLGASPDSGSCLKAALHRYKWVRDACFVKRRCRNNDLISAFYK